MSITEINSSTFLADSVIFIKDKLKDNITSINSKVYTSYPQKGVIYPIITVKDAGIGQEIRLGMRSEGTAMRIPLEIRIWARNVKERDEIFGEVYDYLRTNQFSGDDIIGANLHDFKLDSAVNVDEEKIKSKVCEVSYLFVCI